MPVIPVVAIDGPSASGKGTVAERVAKALGFHYLDSGALYRLVALAARNKLLSATDVSQLESLTRQMDARFDSGKVYLEGHDVTDEIRSEWCSREASILAALPEIRAGLLDRQHAFRQIPGLVADGRDMGSVVFPDASLKVFLTATSAIRAKRRYNQLKDKGISASMEDLLKDIAERDARDAGRPIAPLQQAGARVLDTSSLTIEQSVDKVLGWFSELRLQVS